jgi:PAS domain S-box-containing protein
MLLKPMANLKNLLIGLGLVAVYFLAAKWGLTLAFVQANATAVWPPTGIALAALLMGGWRLWPGIFIGAFLANLFTAGNVATSLGIATGNTLEALCGFYLVSRFAHGREALTRTTDLFKFAILGGIVAPLVSATVGVGTLALAGMTGGVSLKAVWLTWWLGDMGGALLVAPPILLWSNRRPEKLKIPRILEGSVVVGLLLLLAWVLFGGRSVLSVGHYPVEFLFIPLLLWVALRFDQFQASVVVLFLSLSSILGTIHGLGPFHAATENQSLLLLQSFMSVTSLTILALACGIQERKQAEEDLRWSHSDLQLRVMERTEDLLVANLKLEKEARNREALTQEILESKEKFHLLSEATGEGVAIVLGGKIDGMNSIFCQIFDYGPDEVIGKKPEDFVAPECREAVRQKVLSGFDQTYRTTGLRKDGSRIDLEVTGKTVRRDGETVRITAIQDVSERNRRDEERRRLALLVETSSDFICLTSVDGHMLYVNGDGRRLVGLELEEDVTSKLHEDFIIPEDVPRLQNEVIASMVAKGHWEGEFKLRHFKTGETLPFHFTAVLVKDPSTGQPQAMAAIGRDISLQKMAEAKLKQKSEELQNSEKYFRALIENALDIVTILDGKGEIHFESPSITRFLGYSQTELYGLNVFTLVHPEDVDRVQKVFGELMEGHGNIREAKFRFKHKDGSWRILESIGTNLLSDEAIKGVVVNSRDVTLEEEAQKAIAEKEERFRLLVDNAHDYSIIFLDPEGRVVSWNEGARRLKGYEEKEILGKHFSCFYILEDREAGVPQSLLKAAESGRTEHEGWRQRKDGSRFWANVVLTALFDARGRLRGYAKITRDVTEKKETQRRMEESESRFRSVIESANDAIIIGDGQGHILTWNRGAQSIFGYEGREVFGKPISILMPEKYRQDHQEGLRRVRETGKSRLEGQTVEMEGVRKDGAVFPIELSLSSWTTEKRRFFGGIIRDITERKKIQELSRSNQELEQFAYVASHDLQEPLRMVTSFVQLLARKYEGKLDPEADQYIHQVVDGAGRMRTLILDLLAYSRVDSAGTPFIVVNCDNALRQVLSNLETTLTENAAVVESEPLPSVKGDFNQIVQLLQNLISNAVKFKGKHPPKIRVEARLDGENWVFCVRDNGIGIDPKYSNQIFEIFKRLHTRSEYPGTGIGLAICKKVVTRHGGRIWVESQAGQGAAFYWTLPVLKEALIEPKTLS